MTVDSTIIKNKIIKSKARKRKAIFETFKLYYKIDFVIDDFA